MASARMVGVSPSRPPPLGRAGADRCGADAQSATAALGAGLGPHGICVWRLASSPSRRIGMGLHQGVRDGQAQHAVAQELEPLIGPCPTAAQRRSNGSAPSLEQDRGPRRRWPSRASRSASSPRPWRDGVCAPGLGSEPRRLASWHRHLPRLEGHVARHVARTSPPRSALGAVEPAGPSAPSRASATAPTPGRRRAWRRRSRWPVRRSSPAARSPRPPARGCRSSCRGCRPS